MMTGLLTVTAVVLLGTIGIGLVRVVLGPTHADRMMAAQLMGTTGIAVLLVLAPVVRTPGLVDAALVFALLAAVAVTAFTRRRLAEEGD
jgi:multicomponent Na+:H+ antiporter subunit F